MTHLVVFLGPPGAGKGTQAIKIASDFNLAHISTGDMLRQHVKEQTDLGKIAKSLLDEGKLVPDDLVIQMLIERLGDDDCLGGTILDGFPRTLPQAKSLENNMNHLCKGVVSRIFITPISLSYTIDKEDCIPLNNNTIPNNPGIIYSK